MEKRWGILIVVGIILVILFFLLLLTFIFGNISIIQSISTDKKIYSVGEPININWIDFGINSASCYKGTEMKLFKSGTDWEEVKYHFTLLEIGCVNNIPTRSGTYSCNSKWTFPMPYYKNGYFNLKFYLEPKGEVNDCDGQKYNFKNYEITNLTQGHYKVQVGISKAYFDIK